MTESAPRSGVLVVDKAAGITSFDVVALVRRRLRPRRVGHAGTLDPGAVGVLPVLIGEATKLMPYLQDMDKEYLATLRFGVRTDTLDLDGRVIATSPVPPLDRDVLIRITRAFVGRIKQVPPMYSALHHEGRRLYELARRGLEVVRAPREVMVHAITVEEVVPPTAMLRIVCGKGTYVRTLAADLGEAVGCGAAIERLVRSRVGPFGLGEAVASSEISGAVADALWRRVLPPEATLAGWPVIRLDAPAALRFLQGQAAEVMPPLGRSGRFVAVHAAEGGFFGVGELMADGGRVRPARILHADRPGPRVLPA
ncbi:MAG TPA: tRNA pseudouridine(55) synthase TruB [Methylomirabilota bacterium]|jgi:tRNA pseudouridine55 synthase|nr:tRNA pseudouridine(55) synthase TruB [Methylomirabilota bacterium]